MLTELRIADLGVIAEAVLEPGPGFTAVTGETGAGKTMVVTGLSLLLGGRADSGLVRHGATRCVVEGVWTIDGATADELAELGAEVEDGELLVARQVGRTRSRALLGGVAVPLGTAADIVTRWATIHGQSEQIRLGTADRQREVLDRFAGAEHAVLLERHAAAYAERRAAASEVEELTGAARERARELDLLTFGLNEIEQVDPQPDEDVALAAARKSLEGAVADDPELVPLAGRLAEASVLAADVASELASYADRLEAEPARLEWIAERRAALQQLTRKYGASVAEVLQWAADAAERARDLEAGDDRIAELQQRIAVLDEELAQTSAAITAARSEAAAVLAERVKGELIALAMPHARIEFELTPAAVGPHGADQVTLMFTANPGSSPAPLAKAASGGELSRVRLALEVVLAGGATGQTFVFDEVDAGVGGAVALEIGRRLARLAEHAQVIVVTHLAQVAAFADDHFVVAKASDGQVTTSGINRVDGAARLDELARMMAGLEGSANAHAHAAELLAAAGH